MCLPCPLSKTLCTLAPPHAQCVKDMARLGRDLRRVILVDDTPLAFLHQVCGAGTAAGFVGSTHLPLDRTHTHTHTHTRSTARPQPDNGVPVLGFRGDPDDRLLEEAVLPLIQTLAAESDVQPVLHRRFDMANWFKVGGKVSVCVLYVCRMGCYKVCALI